jgi:hypothetical protein
VWEIVTVFGFVQVLLDLQASFGDQSSGKLEPNLIFLMQYLDNLESHKQFLILVLVFSWRHPTFDPTSRDCSDEPQ